MLETQVRQAETRWLELWKRGPRRMRWSGLPPQVGDPAPDVELRDVADQPIRLRGFWKDGPALLLFWRHYGCGCGMERASRLHEEHPDYVAAGAHVVVIGQGDPPRTRAYAEKYGLALPMLCDPELRAYEAFGLPEGGPSQVLYDAPEDLQNVEFEAGLRLATARREALRPLVDNPWQLPGEFVVDKRGVLRLAYRYQYCEDFPDPRVLLTAIRQANAGKD